MNARQLLAATLAALVLSTGVATAAGPAGSASQTNDSDAEAADGERGPPSGLPEAVPDHVSAIHDAVGEFLSGALDATLGDVVSDVAGDGAGESGDAGQPADAGNA